MTIERVGSCSPKSKSAGVGRARSRSHSSCGGLVLLFYIITIVRLGPNVLTRPL